ncbi:thiamine pyrophosphate-dependent dehydrogenase E1 component subunit alpha [Gemmatimonas sp.]|uniref:thiamine pyrophosphate-dependent dehydrogenase E1 component subunit alpha n=1 Tax=Gemmatimonas sp. TaxID=1962908 RepID=UPI00286BF788|nr:thiamine pyrophosphate-dependent dehydrogenase E1 component subunit alpha [Gemmatimonas sp.]
MAKARTGRVSPAVEARPSDALSRERKLDLYYWMKLTRQLEERLVNLYRQTKVVGGLFRSLGQEADAVGSCFALEQRDVMSPLIRNLGAMLVKGATPVEVLKQYMAKADSPTRGRELNIHFGDIGAAGATRGFLGQISPLGDMVPVMTGVTMSFKMRGEDRVGLVYVGDGATSTGAFHEGINFAAVQKCPLVVVVENNGYAYSTPTHKQSAAKFFVDKAIGYGVLGLQADGNDVLATYDVTKIAVDHARAGHGVALVELITYRRKGHAEHDNQSYVPAGEIEQWAEANDPIDRYVQVLRSEHGATDDELAAIDTRIVREIDEATDLAELSGTPDAREALLGVYAEPPAEQPLWFRRDAEAESRAYGQERPESWGTWNADGAKHS